MGGVWGRIEKVFRGFFVLSIMSCLCFMSLRQSMRGERDGGCGFKNSELGVNMLFSLVCFNGCFNG